MAETKKIILHVDDEPDTLAVVKTILEKEGFKIVGVGFAKEALAQIKQRSFDLILLDIMMPDMSGWELFTHIMAIRPEYKIIFLTVLELAPERVKELKEKNIKGYIRKPFSRDDLVMNVKRIIES